MTKGLTCLTRFAVLTVTAVVSLCAQRPDISWMRGGHWSGPYLLAYSPDGTTLISIGEDIKVWSVSDGMLLRTIRSPFVEFFNPGSSALSADSTLVAAAGVVSKTVALVRTDDPGADPQWNIPLASPYLSFSPDGSQIVASGIFGNPAIYFLSPIDGSVARTIPYIQFPGGVHEPSSAAVFSPGAGSTLALCSSDYAQLLTRPSAGDGTSYSDFGEVTCPNGGLVWSLDSQYIATRGALWAAASGCPSNNPNCTPPTPLTGFPNANIAYNAFSAAGQLAHGFAPTTTSNSIQIWNPAGGRTWSLGTTFAPANPQDPTHLDSIGSLTYAPDSSALAVGLGTAIQLWNPNGAFDRNITVDWGTVAAVAVSPDGTMAAAGSASNSGTDTLVNIYDLATGNLLKSIVAAPDITSSGVVTVHFTPDSKSVVASVTGNVTREFSVADGSQQKSLTGIACAGLSPDGTYLASGPAFRRIAGPAGYAHAAWSGVLAVLAGWPVCGHSHALRSLPLQILGHEPVTHAQLRPIV